MKMAILNETQRAYLVAWLMPVMALIMAAVILWPTIPWQGAISAAIVLGIALDTALQGLGIVPNTPAGIEPQPQPEPEPEAEPEAGALDWHGLKSEPEPVEPKQPSLLLH